MAETSTVTPLICFVCDEPIRDGDPVYEDVNDGLLHADCCGPERESYAGADGEPLKPGEPIPQPWIYRGSEQAKVASFKQPAARGEFRNIYRRADGGERHGCTWSTREAAEEAREVLPGEAFVELRDMRNATNMALIGVGMAGGVRG